MDAVRSRSASASALLAAAVSPRTPPLAPPPDRGGYSLIPTGGGELELEPGGDRVCFESGRDGEVPRRKISKSILRRAGATVDNSVEGTECKDRLGLFLQGLPFQLTMAGLICSNAVVVGLETDFPEIPYWKPLENLFLFVFTIELLLRMYTEGLAKYVDHHDEDFVWNLFDFMIVSSGLIDFSAGLLRGEEHGGGLATVFRVARLMRILRVLRIVRFLRQLYTLAVGFILAAVAITWVSVLMVFILYICSVILVRNVKTMPEEDKHSDNYDFLVAKFGSIPQSMLTLFELMVNPFIDPYHDVMFQDKTLMCFVIGFVVFGSFGMIALLSGVISEAMFENNQLKVQEKQLSHDATRKKLIRHGDLLFDELEINEDGEAPVESLIDLLPQIAQMFQERGLSFACDDEYDDVVKMMDLDCSGTISKQEFSKFLKIMAEGVRPLLLMDVRADIVRCLGTRLDKFEEGMVTMQARNSAGPSPSGGCPPGCQSSGMLTGIFSLKGDLEAAVSRQQAQLDGLVQLMSASLHEATANVESCCAAACADAARRAVLECLPPPVSGDMTRSVPQEFPAPAFVSRNRSWPSLLNDRSPASRLPTLLSAPTIDQATRWEDAAMTEPLALARTHGGLAPGRPPDRQASAAALPQGPCFSDAPRSESAREHRRPWDGGLAAERTRSCDALAGPPNSQVGRALGASTEATHDVSFRDAFFCQHK